MESEIAKYTLRIDSELLKKFRYVAGHNARSANKELEVIMKQHVEKFEDKYGEIKEE